MLTRLYDWVLDLSGHRHAPAWLAGLSAAESSFFPIPPDVLLAPMCLAKPRRAWFFAAITTVSSVLGGLLGYAIGRLAFESIEGWLMGSRLADTFISAVGAFGAHGFWYILLAGFTPIPYKVFTIAAGVVGMPLLPFTLGSLVGRGGRFFLVAFLIRLGGEHAAAKLRTWVDRIGWAVLAVLAIGWAVWHFWSAS